MVVASLDSGTVAERTNAAALKAAGSKGLGGSNPSRSARFDRACRCRSAIHSDFFLGEVPEPGRTGRPAKTLAS